MTFLESTVHCHTNLCDGNNTPAEMAKAAFESGIKVLGLSGHSHTPHDDSYCMSRENTVFYRQEIARLRPEIVICCGVANGRTAVTPPSAARKTAVPG